LPPSNDPTRLGVHADSCKLPDTLTVIDCAQAAGATDMHVKMGKNRKKRMVIWKYI